MDLIPGSQNLGVNISYTWLQFLSNDLFHIGKIHVTLYIYENFELQFFSTFEKDFIKEKIRFVERGMI